MAKARCTPVDYWLSLPLSELAAWISDHNALIEEENERLRQMRAGK